MQLLDCKKIINALNLAQTSLCSRTRKNLLNLQTRKAVYFVTKYKLKWDESKHDLIKQDLTRPTPVWRFQIVSSVLNDVFRHFRRYKKIFDGSRTYSNFSRHFRDLLISEEWSRQTQTNEWQRRQQKSRTPLSLRRTKRESSRSSRRTPSWSGTNWELEET